jgi:hypothetical protein
MLTGSGEHQHIRDVVLAVDRSLPTAETDIYIPETPRKDGTRKGISITPRAGHNAGMICSLTRTSPLGLEPKADQKEGSGSQRNSHFVEHRTKQLLC